MLWKITICINREQNDGQNMNQKIGKWFWQTAHRIMARKHILALSVKDIEKCTLQQTIRLKTFVI